MLTSNSKNFSVIILAAGYSNRMGADKLFLKFDDKRNFFEKIIEEYINFGSNEIVLVLNEENSKLFENEQIIHNEKITIVKNLFPLIERFFSVQLGSRALKKSNYTFIQNIDNPFVNLDILKKLAENIENFDFIVPEYNKKGGHPILLSPKVIDNIKNEKIYKNTLKEYLSGFKQKRINVKDEIILTNINTPEDYHKLFKNTIY